MTMFRIDLFYALFAGSVLTGLLFHHGMGLFSDLYSTITNLNVLTLMVAFLFVFYLSNLLTDSGILSNMLGSLEKLIKDTRFVIISLPFMIGLVPAPSGAVISAPFVEELGSRMGLKPEKKLVINYWFRHITEYLNPVYPGPILAVTILGITFKDLFLLNMPIMVFDFLLGFVMFVAFMKSKKMNTEKATGKDIRIVLNGILPIFIAILLPIVIKLNLAISIAISIVLIVIVNKIKLSLLKGIIKKSLKYDLLLLILSVMFFKAVLENSKAIELVSNAFLEYHIPHFLLVILLPLITGFITGITIGYVGLTFPLLLPFFGADLNLAMLAYVSGYVGVLASPTHLCLSVTQKYFNASYAKVYKSTLPALAILMCFAVFLALVKWYRF
jgi:integral membrane protein (TIGR00529 family)